MECPTGTVFDNKIYPTLRNVGPSLDELTLNYMDVQRLSFRRVLKYCPNISRLMYNGYNFSSASTEGRDSNSNKNDHGDDDYNSNNTINTKAGHRLTHIFLHIDNQGADPYDVRCLLQQTQQLEQLFISYCHPEIFDIIFDCCPDLPYLNYNMSVTATENEVRMTFYDDKDGCFKKQRGMQVLKLANYQHPMTAAQIKKWMIYNSTTLKSFDFSTSLVEEIPDLITLFTPLSASLPTTNNMLRQFHWDAPISLESEALPLVIQNCPQLEDIKLSTINLAYLQLILSELHHLQKLHLVGCQDMKEQDWIDFFVWWKKHSMITNDKNGSTTSHRNNDNNKSSNEKKTLVLEECESLTNEGIYRLADIIPYLRTLSLNNINDNLTESGILHFFHKAKKNGLECIQLMMMDCVTDHVLEENIEFFCAELKKISLIGLDHVTMQSIRKLIHHTTCLCHLYIIECGDIFGTNEEELKKIGSTKGINFCTTRSLPL